ncbi:hypothetical protein G210_3509 [Candida maltosa Xu316]|uniref:Uncharacterized protein n=1 Tax=Candida maltosa (strain Xu316) TaxID=1245528 RepID=M3IIQ8_CANMX|nr:hypothetical protein G210_3509 [Candida maltosa Xu316]
MKKSGENSSTETKQCKNNKLECVYIKPPNVDELDKLNRDVSNIVGRDEFTRWPEAITLKP